jgi:MFS family permease
VLPKSLSVILRLGTAQTLAWGSTYYLPAILANAMARELGLTTAWIFIAFSAGMVVSAFLGPVAGRLIDAHGGRWVLAASNLVLACGLALLATCSGIGSLLASWIVIGVGMSLGLYEAAFSSLARIYGGDARRAITGITLIAGFASTIAWPLSAYMDVTIGWRATCFAWAVAHLVLGLPLNLSLPTGRAADAAQRAPSSAQGEPRRPWIAAARRCRAHFRRCAGRGVFHRDARRRERCHDHRYGHPASRALRRRGLWAAPGLADGAGAAAAIRRALRLRPAADALWNRRAALHGLSRPRLLHRAFGASRAIQGFYPRALTPDSI